MEVLKLISNLVIAAAMAVIAYLLLLFLIVVNGSEKSWSFKDKYHDNLGNYQTFEQCMKEEVQYHVIKNGLDINNLTEPFKYTCDFVKKTRL